MPEFVLGFADYAALHPEVGEPITDEFPLEAGIVTAQATTTGLLVYYIRANTIHFFKAY